MPNRHRCLGGSSSFRAWIAVVLAAGIMSPAPAFALQPPRDGEIAELKTKNLLDRQVENALRLENHKIDPVRLKKALNKGKRKILEMKGAKAVDVDRLAPIYAPPPAWQGMPTTGNVKALALLVEFQDYTHAATNTQAYVQSNLFGAGDAARTPYESLQAYYSRASYGKLALSGNTLGWYRTAYNRPIDTGDAAAWQVPTSLIKEVINHWDAQGHDFSQYDNNNDGVIDYFVVIWSGPNGPWASLWWGWYTVFGDSTFTVDGKRLGKFSWQWEGIPVGSAFTPRVVIHETGHALGLPDLYDYDGNVGPDGGVGGLDMMDANRGDHNCFSKWVLEWNTPTFVASGSQMVHLQPSGTAEDCVVVWPDTSAADQFSEFFVAQNRQRAGNDAGTMPADGMLVWHVDASLDAAGQSYQSNNSYSPHKLVRLMEADGLEHIESNMGAEAGDYWANGKHFGQYSVPSSRRYDAGDSRVMIYNFTAPAADMAATFEITGAAVADGWIDDGAAVRLALAADRVGVGTASPTGKLHVDVDGDGSGTLYVEDDGTRKGNVGIGTTRPAYRLTLGDQATTQSANYLEINASTWAGVIFHGGGRGADITYNHTQNYMRFETSAGDGTGPWERMRITGTGNVGIGTANPGTNRLAVVGDVEISAPSPTMKLTAYQQSPARVRFADYGSSSTQNFEIFFDAADEDLHFKSDEIESLKLTNDGIIYFTPKNLHQTHPTLAGSQLVLAWNQSGGRGETVFYQHGGAGWKAGYDFWSERNGQPKRRLASLEDTGNLKLLGTVGSLSDVRAKKGVRTIANALEKVLALRGVAFEWKDSETRERGTHLGLVAQEVLGVVPEVVMSGDEEDELYALQYDGLIPVLIEALKEQQTTIHRLAERVSELESRARAPE